MAERATVGRIVHVHGPWSGPRPAIVVGVGDPDEEHPCGLTVQVVRANVLFDVDRDRPYRGDGMTCVTMQLPLFLGPLDPDQRLIARRVGNFATWPEREQRPPAAPAGDSGTTTTIQRPLDVAAAPATPN